jgi:hypothetical protein
MLAHVDYALSASSFVTKTFLDRGFKPERVLPRLRPIDLTTFTPSETGRPKDRPLTLICTAAIVTSGVNGEIAPIRNPQAIADAVVNWADQLMARLAPARHG